MNTVILPDGSAFFVEEIDTSAPPGDPIRWNPWNKVVHDHRDGTIIQPDTDIERAKRGLGAWTLERSTQEVMEPPIP